MFFKNYQNMATATEMITTFGGYCHRDVISDGQWFDMTNMSARKYPAITTRPNRQILTKVNGEAVSNVAAMVDMDGLVWLGKDGSLHAGGNVLPNFYTYTEADRQMVPMGGYLIVFPDKVWANAVKLKQGGKMVQDEDYGSLEAYWEQGDDANTLPITKAHAMRILPCKPDGSYWDFAPSSWEKSAVKPTYTTDTASEQNCIVTSEYPYQLYTSYIGANVWYHIGDYYGYSGPDTVMPKDPEANHLVMKLTDDDPVLYKWMETTKMWSQQKCMLRIESSVPFEHIQEGDSVDIQFPAYTRWEEDYDADFNMILSSGVPQPGLALISKVGADKKDDGTEVHYLVVETTHFPQNPVTIYSLHHQLVYLSLTSGFADDEKEAAWVKDNDTLRKELEQIEWAQEELAGVRPVTISRKIPDMDYVIESNNRLWGCFYGERDGKMLNEIYASKLGDFKNWNSFQGLSTDSYAASRGSDGPWTGAITMNNYPLFFKRNCLEKVYISASGAHQIATTKMPGVQPGSWRSMQIVDGVLFYLSDTGVMVYDGSLPDHISNDFGNVKYSDGVAGKQGYNYYLSVKAQDGSYSLFNLDTTKGVWHREDDTRLTQTADRGDVLYMLTEDGKLLTPGTLAELDDGELEGDFTWEIVSGAIGYQRAEQEYLLRLIPRIKLERPLGGSALVHVMYDDNGDWQRVAYIRGNGTQSMKVPVKPRRCDHFRIKLSGVGETTLYTITREIERGSVET